MAVEVSNVPQQAGVIEGIGNVELLSIPTLTSTNSYAVKFKQSHVAPKVFVGQEIAGAVISAVVPGGCTLAVTGATNTSVSLLVIG
jgi:hypothetical protein